MSNSTQTSTALTTTPPSLLKIRGLLAENFRGVVKVQDGGVYAIAVASRRRAQVAAMPCAHRRLSNKKERLACDYEGIGAGRRATLKREKKMPRIPVGIAGATGVVGQTFVALLERSQTMKLTRVSASLASTGSKLADHPRKTSLQTSEETLGLSLGPPLPDHFRDCGLVFSALSSRVAETFEKELLRHAHVFSNASAWRMHPRVPLVIPHVNPGDMLWAFKQESQLSPHCNKTLVANPNCTTVGLSVFLEALLRSSALGPIQRTTVTTMQAVSGAGYRGVGSMEILGNVVPYIAGEEEKIASESFKILGSDDRRRASVAFVEAQCNRVPVLQGHLLCVDVYFERAVETETVVAAMEAFNVEAAGVLPWGEKSLVLTKEGADRPQPRLDVHANGGVTVTVGRLRVADSDERHLKAVLLVDNVLLGAAACSVWNAELAIEAGLVQ